MKLRSLNIHDDTGAKAAIGLGSIGDQRSAILLPTFLNAADNYLAEICREALLRLDNRK